MSGSLTYECAKGAVNWLSSYATKRCRPVCVTASRMQKKTGEHVFLSMRGSDFLEAKLATGRGKFGMVSAADKAGYSVQAKCTNTRNALHDTFHTT